jgi:DNA-binding transcriptional LysR family regulator
MVARITLEMWRVFVAIATDGSSQKAADSLHKSQSAVSHALKKWKLN